MLRIICMFGLLIATSSTGYGDILPGREWKPAPPMVAPVKIVEQDIDGDPNAVAKIVIPKSLVAELLDKPALRVSNSRLPPGGTVVAGLAMTALAVSLMFALRKSPQRQWGLVCLIVCVVLGGYLLLADFLFPRRATRVPGSSRATPSQILIEIQDEGHEVILISPRFKSGSSTNQGQ